MRQRIRLEREGNLARIGFEGSERGAEDIQAALIDTLGQALAEAQAIPGLAVVLIEGGWPSGSDGPSGPALLDLAERIAASPVPVVAAFDGMISGAALALFLAAAWRVARPGARFSAPEFGLGMMPAGGVVVRLARRAGAFVAADFLASGRVLPADQALRLGLCDEVSQASTFPPPAPPSAATDDPQQFLADLSRFRGQIPPGPLAPVASRIVEVLEAAALLPTGEAIIFEEVASQDLYGSELSAALRHVARARQQAARLAGVHAPAAPARRVALWNQPDRLSLGLLRAGVALRLGTSEQSRLELAVRAMATAQDEAVAAGRLSAQARDAAWSLFEPAVAPEDLAPTELTIAAPRPAELAPLRATAGLGVVALEGVAPEGAELGLARLPGVVEIHAATAAQDLPRLAAALRSGRDLVIHARDLGRWLEVAYIAAAERALMAGASPDAVDAALTGWGFAEGPFARLDRRGLDPILARLSGTPWRAGPYLNWLAIEDRRGRAFGRGVRLHDDGPRPWPGEDEELVALRHEAGAELRPMPAREIVASVLAELALAGALALQSGSAHRASDIDLAAIAGLGLARHRGGPMFQADLVGLLTLRKRLRALERAGAPAPAPLLDVLIRNGRQFSDLDAAGAA